MSQVTKNRIYHGL